MHDVDCWTDSWELERDGHLDEEGSRWCRNDDRDAELFLVLSACNDRDIRIEAAQLWDLVLSNLPSRVELGLDIDLKAGFGLFVFRRYRLLNWLHVSILSPNMTELLWLRLILLIWHSHNGRLLHELPMVGLLLVLRRRLLVISLRRMLVLVILLIWSILLIHSWKLKLIDLRTIPIINNQEQWKEF